MLIPVLAGLIAAADMRAGLPFIVRLLTPGAQPAGQLYTVAQVQAGLLRNPAAWTDRTIWLRGTAVGLPCPSDLAACGPQTLLVGTGAQPLVFAQLSVAAQADNDVLRFLRRVPGLGVVLLQPPTLRWNVVATYRVRMRALSCAPISPACYEVVVQDARD
jgi:hypothetical protein